VDLHSATECDWKENHTEHYKSSKQITYLWPQPFHLIRYSTRFCNSYNKDSAISISVYHHYYAPPPPGWEHYAMMVVVCPSVCPVSDPKSRMEGRSKLKIGSREAHDTGDPRSNIEVKGHLRSPGWLTPWPKRMAYDDPHHRHVQWPQRSTVKATTRRRQFDAFAHSSTKSQILAPAATWQIKIKKIISSSTKITLIMLPCNV